MRVVKALVGVVLLVIALSCVAGCESVDPYDPNPWDPEEGKNNPIGIPIWPEIVSWGDYWLWVHSHLDPEDFDGVSMEDNLALKPEDNPEGCDYYVMRMNEFYPVHENDGEAVVLAES